MAFNSINKPSSSEYAKSSDPRGRGFGRSVADLHTLAFLLVHLFGGGPSAHNRRGNRRKQSSDRMTRRLRVFESVSLLLLFLCSRVGMTPQPSSVVPGRGPRSRPAAAAAAISSSPFSSDRGDDDGTMVPSSHLPPPLIKAAAAVECHPHQHNPGTVGGTALSSSSSSVSFLQQTGLYGECRRFQQAGLKGECLREVLSFRTGHDSAAVSSSLASLLSWFEKQQQQQQKQQPAVPSLNVTVTAAMESHHQHPPGFGQDDGHNGTTTVTSFFFVSAAAASSPFSSDRGDDDGTTTLSFLASISTSSRPRFEAVEILLGTDLFSSSLALSLFEPEQQQKEHNDAVVPFPVASAKQYHHNISASVSLSWSSSLLQEQQPISTRSFSFVLEASPFVTGTIETIKIFVANQYDCLLVYLLGQDFGTVRREIGNWLVDPNGCYAFYRTVTIEPISTVVTKEWDRIVKCVGTVQFFGAVLICIGIMCIPLDSSPISFHRSSSSTTASADDTAGTTVAPPPITAAALTVTEHHHHKHKPGTVGTILSFFGIRSSISAPIRSSIIATIRSSISATIHSSISATIRSSISANIRSSIRGPIAPSKAQSKALSACTDLVEDWLNSHFSPTRQLGTAQILDGLADEVVVLRTGNGNDDGNNQTGPFKTVVDDADDLDVVAHASSDDDGDEHDAAIFWVRQPGTAQILDGPNNRTCVSFATNLIGNIWTYPRVLPGDKAKAWWTQEEERIFSTDSLIDDEDDYNNFGYKSRTPSLLDQCFPEDSLAYNANVAYTNKDANSSKVCPPCDVSQRHHSYSLLSLERDELVADADDFDMVDDADVDDTGLNNDDNDDDHDDGLLVGLGPPASSDDDADEDNAIVETVVHHQTRQQQNRSGRRTRRLPVPEQGRHTRGVVDDDSVLGSAYVDGRRRSRRCLGLKQLGTIMLERGLRRSARIRALLI